MQARSYANSTKLNLFIMPQDSQSQSTNNNAATTTTTHESSISSASLQPHCRCCSKLCRDCDVVFGSKSSTDTTGASLSVSSLFGWSRRFEPLKQQHASAGNLPRKCKGGRLSNCFPMYCLKKRSVKEATVRSHSARMAVEVDKDGRGMKHKRLGTSSEKIDALEREVAMLGKRLSNEQETHEVLDRVHKQDPGSAISVTSFVSPKVKSLMTELGEVSEEITRLERQIGKLQAELTVEQEMSRNLKSRSRRLQLLQNDNKNSSSDANNGDASSKGSVTVTTKRVSFEAKPLRFRSKAVKLDLTVSTDFSPSGGRLSRTEENESRGNASLRRNGPRQKQPLSPPRVSLRLQQSPKVRYIRNRQLRNGSSEKHIICSKRRITRSSKFPTKCIL